MVSGGAICFNFDIGFQRHDRKPRDGRIEKGPALKRIPKGDAFSER